MSENKFRDEAEKHWRFIFKILDAYDLNNKEDKGVPVEVVHVLYVEALVHGYKHALMESAKNSG